MHLERASNVLEKEEEIAARPARTWFQSERMKEQIRDASGKVRAPGQGYGVRAVEL